MIKKNIILIFILMFLQSKTSNAQYDRYWLKGYDCCTPNSGGINWDFAGGGAPVISYVQR